MLNRGILSPLSKRNDGFGILTSYTRDDYSRIRKHESQLTLQ